MKGAAVIAVAVVTTILVLFKVQPGKAAISCGQVDSSLVPCVPYLTSGGNPAPACCNGLRNIKQMCPTTADKRAACECAKQAASRYPSIKPDVAAQLPQKCGVDITVPISKGVDCSRVE